MTTLNLPGCDHCSRLLHARKTDRVRLARFLVWPADQFARRQYTCTAHLGEVTAWLLDRFSATSVVVRDAVPARKAPAARQDRPTAMITPTRV